MYCGALLHDLTKGIEPHNETGADLVKSLLQPYCPEEEIYPISEIVRLHNKRGNSDFPIHIKIIQDADVLDHFSST
ncbi:HD domain-containing protein [Peribacillus deserti]|uniref:HD domain-containing protein n=1 Tax=Peribacillus deserti TaxID=673318 RepID=A0A2N5M6G1_9BACI|nr:hypothetical protein CUU66_10530 [Peribacillus deserti]